MLLNRASSRHLKKSFSSCDSPSDVCWCLLWNQLKETRKQLQRHFLSILGKWIICSSAASLIADRFRGYRCQNVKFFRQILRWSFVSSQHIQIYCRYFFVSNQFFFPKCHYLVHRNEDKNVENRHTTTKDLILLSGVEVSLMPHVFNITAMW